MINLSYLRPKKAEAVRNWYNKEFIKRDELEVASFPNAMILPLKRFPGDNLQFGRGGVVDNEGRYVELSSLRNRIFGAYPVSETEYCDEKIVYCGYLINQWGHFLVEAVARLWYFLQQDPSIDKYVFFVNDGEERVLKGNYKEFFELLGIIGKLEIINKPTTYREVVVPELSFGMRRWWSDEYKKIFDYVSSQIKIHPEWESKKKVFLSRSRIKDFDCKEYNMDMLDEFFSKNGFEVVYPENHSLSHLIFLLRNANEIATLSGSVQHNMMFASDGKKHLIMEKTVVTVDFMLDINLIRSFDVTHIDSNLVIYPVSIGYGPYIQVYSGCLRKYAEDNNMLPPDPSFENPLRMKKFLQRYMKIYRQEYQYKWYINDWELQFIESIKEACDEGYEYYKPFLSGQKPFLWHHYFEFHYWKRLLKTILRKA